MVRCPLPTVDAVTDPAATDPSPVRLLAERPPPSTWGALPPRRLDVRAAAPVGAAWLVLVVVLPVPSVLVPVAVAAAVVAVATVVASALVVRRRPGAALAAALALVALAAGATAAVTGVAAARQDVHRPEALAALTGHVAVLEGVAPRASGEGASSMRLDVDRVTAGDLRWRGPEVHVLVLAPRLAGRVAPGERVRLSAVLLPDDGGGPVAFLAAARSGTTTAAAPSGPWSWAEGPRSAFRELTAGLPGDGGALLPGLVLGDTTAVADDLDAAMTASSLTHLTAVSGSNCAVLVTAVGVVGGLLRWRRSVRVVVSVVTLGAFLLIVTPEASIVRATVMAVVVLVHVAAARPVSGLPVVAVAVAGLLVADPWWARDVGFALSVLATAGLVVLSGPLTELLARALPEPLAVLLAVPVAAQLACQPVLVLLDPVVPVHGVLANALAAPAAPLATGLGLVALVTAPVLPGVAEHVAGAAWFPATWIGAVARTVAAWPAGSLPVAAGLVGVAVVTLACGALAALVLARGRARVVVAVAVGVAVVAAVGIVAGRRVGAQLAVPDDWAVAQCDVGQGDAVLVRSAGQVALVDVGDDAAALTGCLSTFGVDRVDLLVLTHWDRDHVGALAAVLDRVDHALVGPTDGTADEDRVAALEAAGATVVDARPGDTGRLGDLDWRVLWPPDGVRPGNDASVVLRVDPAPDCATGCTSLLDLGDLGATAQRRLLRETEALPGGAVGGPVDVLKVAHHGSSDTSAELVRAVAPRLALVGVGAENTYGHPTPEALVTLGEVGAVVTRTDQDGDAAWSPGTSGASGHVWREKGPAHGPDPGPTRASARDTGAN